jgi:fructose-bisphosphate aldolase class II
VLVPFSELLAEAAARRCAIGAFTAYNLETAVAVSEAAAHRDECVMLLISEQAFASRAGPALAQMLCSVAAHTAVPCCVQIDHVTALRTMEDALEAGIGAIMADGSRLSFEENVDLVASAVGLAERFGGGVEAELGRIEGDEEVARAAADGKLTDPEAAESFIARTGADCLAVSIGNAHGHYARLPQLDLGRLEQIRAVTPVPLSLHGASGLSDDQVIATIARGISKVNVNTELRERFFAVVAERAGKLRDGARLLALQDELILALTEVAEAKMSLFAAEAHPIPYETSKEA